MSLKEKVMITKGPFRKIFGEVLSSIGKNRIKVLLNCINGYKTVVADKDFCNSKLINIYNS